MRLLLLAALLLSPLFSAQGVAQELTPQAQLEADQIQLSNDQTNHNSEAITHDLAVIDQDERDVANASTSAPVSVNLGSGVATYGPGGVPPKEDSGASGPSGGSSLNEPNNPTQTRARANAGAVLSAEQRLANDQRALDVTTDDYTTGGVQNRLATCTSGRVESCGPTYYTGGAFYKGEAYNIQEFNDDMAARAAYMNAAKRVEADRQMLGASDQ